VAFIQVLANVVRAKGRFRPLHWRQNVRSFTDTASVVRVAKSVRPGPGPSSMRRWMVHRPSSTTAAAGRSQYGVDMGWESTVIERDTLYREVWSQPMTLLAKQYGISDVALRKVCFKLNVPMPLAGHWAKVRNGKVVKTPPLPAPTNHLQHEIRRWVDPATPELKTRMEKLNVDVPREAWNVAVPTSLEECHKVVRNTDAALDKGRVDDVGRLLSAGRGCCDLRVSPEARTRAVLLCEHLIRCFEAAGLKLEERLTSSDGPRVQAGGRWYKWRITETGVTSDADGATAVVRTTAAGRRRPAPALRVDFLPDGERPVVLTYRDNAQQRLEAKLAQVPVGLVRTAAEVQLRADIAEEQRRAREAQWLDRQHRLAVKKEELERLKVTEDLADRFRRAEALRVYADALKLRRFENQALDDETIERRLRWIQQAADWLDPTLPGRWPAVDDAPQGLW
jgi:hypothetical protein